MYNLIYIYTYNVILYLYVYIYLYVSTYNVIYILKFYLEVSLFCSDPLDQPGGNVKRVIDQSIF